jgi:hypothetical protein
MGKDILRGNWNLGLEFKRPALGKTEEHQKGHGDYKNGMF